MVAPRAETTVGTIEGTALDGCERYAGIPYAAPPVGSRRFLPPEPAARFDGVFRAASFAPHAPQADSMLEQFLGEGEPMVTSEADCLSLNVWTPAADGASRPVLFFVHGGSFLWGASSSPIYGGASFAVAHDVVVVSCNYRLGLLGFTDLAPLGGAPFASSGNLGLQDVVAALRWVQANIGAFGGDRDNVTVFGESAGAMSLGTLLASPAATGLFHRAILQSGAVSHVATPADAAGHVQELLSMLGGPSSVHELQDVPVERLLEVQQALTLRQREHGLVFRPVVDGAVVPAPPLEALAAGAARGIPLLVGTNLDEWRLFSAVDADLLTIDERQLEERVGAAVGGDPGVAIATYRKRLGEVPPKLVLDAVGTDANFRVPAIQLAERHHGGGGQVHMYLFTWPSAAFGGALGSFHGLELPFVFNTLGTKSGSLLCGDAPPAALATAMHAAWASFARHGDPSGGVLSSWPAYEPSTRTTMRLDATPHLEDDPLAEERLLWADRS